MTTKEFYRTILILVVTLFIHSTAYASCSKSYTLGFFNGVWNTSGDASESTYKIQDLIGITYNNEPVKYETFYNHTGASVNATKLQDVAETFIQRAAEIDASGELGRRFEYFWEFIGSSEPTFLDKIKGIFSNAIALFDSLYTAVNTKLVAIISYFTSNPPTEADYATHNAQLDVLAANGEKLMLVGHSQGNLFMNHAYDHILPIVGKDRVAAAHIAPASPTLRGDWVLANIDLVINLLRIQGASSVQPNNLDINASRVDVSGHTLIGTYLDPTRDGRGRVKAMIETEMAGLKCPLKSCVMRLINQEFLSSYDKVSNTWYYYYIFTFRFYTKVNVTHPSGYPVFDGRSFYELTEYFDVVTPKILYEQTYYQYATYFPASKLWFNYSRSSPALAEWVKDYLPLGYNHSDISVFNNGVDSFTIDGVLLGKIEDLI